MYHIQMIDKPSSVESLYEAITHWAGWIEAPYRRWWIALEQYSSNEAGWLGFAGVQLDFERKHVIMTPCEVKTEWRGKGIQRSFLKIREEWALENGFTDAFSLVLQENVVSANNLIKCGYRLIMPPPWTNGKGLYFRKNLNGNAIAEKRSVD